MLSIPLLTLLAPRAVVGFTNEQWASKYVLNKVTPGSADSPKKQQQQMQEVEISTSGLTEASAADAYVLTVPQQLTSNTSSDKRRQQEGLDAESSKDAKARINVAGADGAAAAAGDGGFSNGDHHC